MGGGGRRRWERKGKGIELRRVLVTWGRDGGLEGRGGRWAERRGTRALGSGGVNTGQLRRVERKTSKTGAKGLAVLSINWTGGGTRRRGALYLSNKRSGRHA